MHIIFLRYKKQEFSATQFLFALQLPHHNQFKLAVGEILVMEEISLSLTAEGSFPTSPGFEGFEKRLEVEFYTSNASNKQYNGLRAISRAEIDIMLSAAECTIVSQLSNDKFDSYVLSESSLFVYPLKIVIKTCGTTQILKTIPQLLASASRLSLHVCRCRYSRGSFLFPHSQPFPHGSFHEEVRILDSFFKDLCGSGSKAFVMGDESNHHNWHIYVASVDAEDSHLMPDDATFTVELCMTGLDKQIASKFYKAAINGPAKEMTTAAGISDLLPNSQICDFAFDPCGYSMNGIEGNAHSTIHITPEEGFSYASFETMGYGPSNIELQTLVDRVAVCFKPSFLSISVHVSGDLSKAENVGSWKGSVCPSGYVCDGSSWQDLPGRSAVVYHTFQKSPPTNSNFVTPFSLCASSEEKHSLGYETKKVSNVGDEALCWNKKRFFDDEQVLTTSLSNEEPLSIWTVLKDTETFLAAEDLASFSRIKDQAICIMDLEFLERICKSWQSGKAKYESVEAEKGSTRITDLLSALAGKNSNSAEDKKNSEFAMKLMGTALDHIVVCQLPLNQASARELSSYLKSKAKLESLISHPLGCALIFGKGNDNAENVAKETDKCKSFCQASELDLRKIVVPPNEGVWRIGIQADAAI